MKQALLIIIILIVIAIPIGAIILNYLLKKASKKNIDNEIQHLQSENTTPYKIKYFGFNRYVKAPRIFWRTLTKYKSNN